MSNPTIASDPGLASLAGAAQENARDLDPSAWQHLFAGEGTDEYNDTASELWTRDLLI